MHQMKYRLLAAGTLACATLAAASAAGGAEPYPSRPITMIVPIAAGSSIDVVARLLADQMKEALGQPLIVENITGAGGSIGTARAARAPADGYVLSVGNWNTHVGAPVVYRTQYDVLRDFEPVSRISDAPSFIVGTTALPASTLAELVAWLKQNPDKASAASVGNGSAAHLCAIALQERTGTRFQIVPYRGGAPAIQDLIAGQVQLMCADATNALPHIQAGRIRAYAIAANARLPIAPEVPSVDDAGLPGFYFSQWIGLWAPKDTPRQVIDRLNAAVRHALNDTKVRARFSDLGQSIPPAEQLTPEALASFHAAEVAKWWPIIKAANITSQ